MKNTVNCWNAKVKAKPISSEAKQECLERSETSAWSPDRTVKHHERSAPPKGDDIVQSIVERLCVRIKSLTLPLRQAITSGNTLNFPSFTMSSLQPSQV